MITKVVQKDKNLSKINLIRLLTKYPVFNLKMLSEITEKSREYSKLVVFRLKKENLILEIEKNKYTINEDPIIIASNIIWPSYITGWSALRYHNLTEQLPQTISVASTRTRKKREIKFINTKIEFTKLRPKYFFGYKKEGYGNFKIFIAEKEKALIDSALLKKVSFSEIYDILKNNKKNVNFELFVNYLFKIKNKALIKRFGYVMDFLGLDYYKRLKKFIDYKYIKLDYSLAGNGKKNKKWRIINNVDY